MSFRLKTIIGIILIEGLLLLILVWVGLDNVHRSLRDELVKRASVIATLSATSTRSAVLSRDLSFLDLFISEVMKKPGVIYARILDQDGVVLAEQGIPRLPKKAVSENNDTHSSGTGERVFSAFAWIHEGGKKYGEVEIGLSGVAIQNFLTEAKLTATSLVILLMCLVGVFTFFQCMWLTRKIKALQVGAKKITNGEFGYQIPVTGRDALSDTTREFNTMSNRVGQLYVQLSGAYDELQVRVVERTAELNLIHRISQILVDLDQPMEEMFDEVTDALMKMLPGSGEIHARITIQESEEQRTVDPEFKILVSSEIVSHGKFSGVLEISCPADSQLLQSDDFRNDKQPLLKTICQAISTNITHRESLMERQNMEIQLRHAQKLEAVGQLAAGIAHEINTPTQFINDNVTFLQQVFADYQQLIKRYVVLEKAIEDGAEFQMLLQDIKNSREDFDLEFMEEQIPQAFEQSLDGLARVSKIVKAMKAFSHPGVDSKVPTDIKSAIDTTLDVSRSEWKYHAEIERDFDPDLPDVPVIPGEFNQVLLNLIINAAHAIEAVGDERAGKICVSTSRQGNAVCVEVSDNGCGIPVEIKDRIFEPFFTTKEVGKGSGQGLAIAYSIIVDKHHGTFEVNSEEGKGSVFTILLPLEE